MYDDGMGASMLDSGRMDRTKPTIRMVIEERRRSSDNW